MASIHGLKLKNVKTWMGREGEACQGDVYLGDEKICFWSQDGNGGMDTYYFEKMYSEKKLNDVIKELYKEKPIIYKEMKIDYNIDSLMLDILDQNDLERKFVSKSYRHEGMLVINNRFYRNIITLSKEECTLSNDELKNKLKEDIDSFVACYGKDNISIEIYRDIKDFDIGIPIKKEKIYDIRKLNNFSNWKMIVLEDKTITKEEFDLLNLQEQQTIMELDFVPSKRDYYFYEKNYLLSLIKEVPDKEPDLEER